MTSFSDQINRLQLNLNEEEYSFYLDYIKFCNEQNVTVEKEKNTYPFHVIKKETKPLFKVIKNFNNINTVITPYPRVDFCHKKRVFNNKFKNENKSLYQTNDEALLEFYSNKVEYGDKGTPYRGVSKNGNKFQVILFICGKKRYIETYSNLEEAAKIYDRFAIVFHREKAKTNFKYTKEEYDEIINEAMPLKDSFLIN